jgi:hypothetical protein
MSATTKIKKPTFDNFKLVQKDDSNKRERMNVNQNLRNLSRNYSFVIDEEIDDEPFFDFDSEE